MSAEEDRTLLIPFIDEVGERDDNPQQPRDEQYNLTITRNYKNKTRRVEISKILQDAEQMTNRSLSPVAPIAYESDRDELTELTGAEFELTIKSNNSTIRIRGFDDKSTIAFRSGDGRSENVHDFLTRELDKIFKKPEKDEIEKAVRSVKDKRKLKPICRQKRNAWKALAKSISGLRSGKSTQRRGSVERYPKMVLLDEPKPQNEETDGNKVKSENEEIERCKTKLNRGKMNLNEERKMLNKKKDAVADKKINLGDNTADERFLKKEMDIIAEEKLCVELEKQLLGEEKDILREEQDLLKKEKEVLQKERDLLGEERESGRRGITNVKRAPQQQHHSLDVEDLSYASVPPFYCQYPPPCPYIPVYGTRPFPYCHYSETCCSGRVDPPAPQKDSSTQTEPQERQIEATDPQQDLPFGILSSLFPRIVVMKSFQEEVSSDDAQIFEMPKTESPPPGSEKEGEKGCEESEPVVQPLDLQLEQPEVDNGECVTDVPISEESASEESMPLTRIGRSICEKLNELAIERKRKQAEQQDEGGKPEAEPEIPTAADAVKSPRDITFQFSNRLLKFTIGDENLNFEIAGGNEEKTIVRKSDLWHSSNGVTRAREDGAARGSDQICVSVSDNRSVIFTVRVDPERKWTSEAKVGTDGIDIAGGDFVCREGIDVRNLSPRTDKALRTLKDKLDKVSGSRKNGAEIKFPGLFLIQPFDSRYRGFPRDDYIVTKERRDRDVSAAKSREYYCEECLATMRLIEEENPNVKTMVDKFERIIHLGSY